MFFIPMFIHWGGIILSIEVLFIIMQQNCDLMVDGFLHDLMFEVMMI